MLEATQLWAAHHLIEFQKLPFITQFAILVLCICGLIVHGFKFNVKTAHDGPAIFTTAGILFTFIGIADGLYDFDVNNIESSLPGLLAGLKTAFLASIAGVFVALTLKLRSILKPPRHEGPNAADGVTAEDLYDELGAIRRAIATEADRSLLTELRQQRFDANARLDALHAALSNFLERAAENNSRALIEALKLVIADFNSKITEQFGENFKQLNSAVGQLLEWQQQYRRQLSELIATQEIAAQGLKISAQEFAEVARNTTAFSDAANSIAELIKQLNEQRDTLIISLRSLGELLNSATTSLPEIEEHVVELARQMRDGAAEHRETLATALKSTSNALTNAADEFKTSMLNSLQSHNQQTNDHLRQLSDRTSEQINKLDVALEKELTKSISSLGSQLTSLSAKFVDDYAPLVDRLRELSRITRAAQ